VYKFSTLIMCKKCGKKYKAKKERGKIKYVCSGYERFGKEFCERNILKEEELDKMLEFKFKKKFTVKEVWDIVDQVIADGEDYLIFYKDGSLQEKSKNFIKYL
jgi:hypothetical protein